MSGRRLRMATRRVGCGILLTCGLGADRGAAEVVKLSPPIVFTEHISTPGVSPTGRHVHFMIWDEAGTSTRFFTVRLPDGEPTELASDGFGTEVHDWQVSPDGIRMVYVYQAEGESILYSVPIDGPADDAVRLSPDAGPGGYVVSAQVSPDASRVLFRASLEGAGVWALWSVPIEGPADAAVRISADLVAGGNVTAVWASPDSSRAIYLADQEVDQRFELWSVPIDGPPAAVVKLNAALDPSEDVLADDVAVAPDSSRVVYTANRTLSDAFELYSVPAGGPGAASVRLHPPLAAGRRAHDVAITTDSARVVYELDPSALGIDEAWSSLIAGPEASAVRLSPAPPAGGEVSEFVLAPNGTRAVIRGDLATDTVDELWSVPVGGPAAAGVKISGAMVAGGEVLDLRGPRSGWVVYRADQEVNEWALGYRVPLAGPAAQAQRIWLRPYCSDAYEYQIAPDGSFVLVQGNEAFVDGIERLWTVPLSGTPNPDGTDWLGDVMPEWGDVAYRGSVLLPDGRGAVYLADQELDGKFELYALYFRLWGDNFELGDLRRWSVVHP